MTAIKIPKGEFQKFFVEHAQMIVTEGKTYLFCPYWIEQDADNRDGDILAYHLGELPENLKLVLQSMRESPEYMANALNANFTKDVFKQSL